MFERVREDISCVKERDPAARSSFEVLTTYPGVWAVMLHRLTHSLWTGLDWGVLKWLARVISNVARIFTGIEIHPGAVIGRRFFIDHGMGVVIGETTIIGNCVTLYQGVTLGGTSLEKGKRHPTLEDNVVVGAGAKILGPFTVGKGARVGSNAVVLKEVPDGATVVGIPAQIVGQASPADIAEAAAEFEPYGTHQDMPDPNADEINALNEQVELLNQRLKEMQLQIGQKNKS